MKGERIIVGTAPTVILRPQGFAASYPMSALVRNLSSGTVYIGGQDVDTSTGCPLQPNESITFDTVNETIYAVAVSPTEVAVLRRGD